MAFPTKDLFTFDHTAQTDYPNWTPAQTKTDMNARGEELRVALNAVVNLLNSTTAGASGSENIASATIAGITGNTVYAQIASLLAIAQAAQSGAIVPGSITDTMLSNATGQIKDIISKATALATASTLALRDINGALTASKFMAGTKNVVESLDGNYRIQSGRDSIVITTAGTAVTKDIPFPVPFTIQPQVVVGIAATSGAISSGYVFVGADNYNATTLTVRANCYQAQTVFFTWIAIGS